MLRVIFAAWILSAVGFAAQTVEGRVVNSRTGAGIPGVAVSFLPFERLGASETGGLARQVSAAGAATPSTFRREARI